MERVIGIDFGTSTTYMNTKNYEGCKADQSELGYMPITFNFGAQNGFVQTIMRENSDGTFDFGEKADSEIDGTKKIYREFKMNLESADEEKKSEARNATEKFFKFLYESYNRQIENLGESVEENTLVSYPVKWQKETGEFMVKAAEKAGFKNVIGIDEASAAVTAVLVQNKNTDLIGSGKPGYLMLVDMGAGTTDITICKYELDEAKKVKVDLVTIWPQDANAPTFGGREIDKILED